MPLMTCKNFFPALVLIITLHAGAQTQVPNAADTSKVNTMLLAVKDTLGKDPASGLGMAAQVKAFAEKITYPLGAATATKLMGNANFYLGQPENALLLWQEALKIFETAQDKVGQADLLGNIGIFYYRRGDELKALDHHLRSLKIAESVKHKPAVASALINIGGVYYMKPATHDKALRYYQMALPVSEELGNQTNIGTIAVNMGDLYMEKDEKEKALDAFHRALKAYASDPVQLPNVYFMLGEFYLKYKDFPASLKNYETALKLSTKTNDQHNIARAIIGKAKVYSQQGDYKAALGLFSKAEKIILEINSVLEFERLYYEMATAYAQTGDYANAYKYSGYFTKVKDSLYNIETDNKMATVQFDYDLEKKENEIALLTKDKSIKELELKKQQTFNNGLGIVLALIVVMAMVLFRSYRMKAKNNVLLDKKNLEIERLLLNILPAEVAHELRATGQATPRNYEQVSVMFTDFRGFTSLADKMTPQELVTELGSCFMAFDNIIEKYGLEKIKTIGDSYMCAGGIPIPSENHVFRMVKASLEIQEYVKQKNYRRKESGLAPWDIRIGIHVGPVVAGVVGKKKYAYDIWGSTVNIASRMESSGMPGHVNVSAAIYDIIKDHYACVYRGKIQAKNVGEIDMYLVSEHVEAPPKSRSFEEVKLITADYLKAVHS
jgi:class 3 adenylate cyclase/Tfp pilus assembly protein PilF